MNRNPYLLIFGLAAAWLGLGDARPEAGRAPEEPETRRVTIDGRTFDPSFPADMQPVLLKRELSRWGADLPGDFADRWKAPTSHRDPPGIAVPCANDPGTSPATPSGWVPAHTLRMTGSSHTVEIAFGVMNAREDSIEKSLIAGGWESGPRLEENGRKRVLYLHRGKEDSVVFLDDANRAFLLLRRIQP